MSAPNTGLGRTVAISNRKGGTGKTTTAVNLATALGERGRSVLVVDLDPQRSASIWLGVGNAERGTLRCLMRETAPSDIAKNTLAKNVDLVPSTEQMTSGDRLLEQQTAGQNERLREAIEGETTRWDYVIFDCPANFGRVTMNALVAANELILPIEASDMALDGTADLLGVFEDIRKYHNEALSVLGFLICRVDHRTNHAASVIDQMRRQFGDLVFNTTIAQNVAVPDSYRAQSPTLLAHPDARASEEYRSLSAEIMKTEPSFQSA
jgi:chromosome partitioning protein